MNNQIDFRSIYGHKWDSETQKWVEGVPTEQAPADLAEAMTDACNGGMFRIKDAAVFVKNLLNKHRTLQALVMNFFVAVVYQYGKQVGEWTDPRNEEIAKTCKRIAKLYDEEQINYNRLI